jgi:hypothetical protein
MARRKKSSPAEDLIELVALLPWWAGVALALLSYLLLHQVAAQPITAAPPGRLSAMVTQGLWKGLASVGQYVLLVICLVAAGVSAWRRKGRQRLATATPAYYSHLEDGDAAAHCWVERRLGAWIQDGGEDFHCKRALQPRLLAINIEPLGYSDQGPFFA